MDPNYARKLSTEDLRRRLVKSPYNTTIVNELYKRTSKVTKCEIEAQKRIDRENAHKQTKLSLGYKTESYFTENEMIKGFDCTFEQLSESEKIIFNNL